MFHHEEMVNTLKSKHVYFNLNMIKCIYIYPNISYFKIYKLSVKVHKFKNKICLKFLDTLYRIKKQILKVDNDNGCMEVLNASVIYYWWLKW